MANKEFWDWSAFTAAENGLGLLGNAIRKSLSNDTFLEKCRFKVRALTDMYPLSSFEARALNNSATSATDGKVQAFRGRILGENSPHAFLPDPCDPTRPNISTADQKRAWQIISMHTLFLASDQKSKADVTRGDIVYVELEKGNNVFNLEYGTFLTLTSVEDLPADSASCISLQDLPLDSAAPMEDFSTPDTPETPGGSEDESEVSETDEV